MFKNNMSCTEYSKSVSSYERQTKYWDFNHWDMKNRHLNKWDVKFRVVELDFVSNNWAIYTVQIR